MTSVRGPAAWLAGAVAGPERSRLIRSAGAAPAAFFQCTAARRRRGRPLLAGRPRGRAVRGRGRGSGAVTFESLRGRGARGFFQCSSARRRLRANCCITETH